ncbi:hypothetical protein BST47_18540 [Mycolicibacterium tusciae]|uniref:Uncharacterized protein n=1 Tax=Mycolicibacterium tusciae TaxID=75922 RepID=A0A1X0JMK1_9MYCO|nr:hypothetical protein BST47_18540 [Mycolicibacterium tusciae]
MELFTQLRQEYRSVCNAITVLKADIAAGNGPSMRAADQDLARMRQQIDADRPYGHAVATVMAQWSDADAAYNDSMLLLEHARTRLLALTSTPGADEIDIASAQQELAFYTELLPDQPPSAQYQQALAQAQAARSAAAGGPIVAEHDIIAARDVAEAADRATLHELCTHRQALHDRLQRAESDIAAAFDTAHTRATQTLEQLLDTAYCEVNLLRSARHLDTKAAPLRMPESALSQHDPAIATRLNALAAQPYRLGFVHADSTDPDTAAALRTLRAAANDSNRKLLWISASDNAAAIAQDSGVADTYTTIGDDLADKLWSPGPDAIVIIDNPATIDPEQLAITTNYITTNGARAIILNPADEHIGPATSALRLLATTIPWATTLTATKTAVQDRPDTPTPAIAMADRLGRSQLDQRWRDLLTHYDTTTRAIRSAHRLHLTLTWHDHSHNRTQSEHSLDTGIDD